MADLGRDLAERIDLIEIPYTARFSRLLVAKGADGLTVYRAAYEVPLDNSIVVDGLTIRRNCGDRVGIDSTVPTGIEFAGGEKLFVDAADCIHIGGLVPGAVVEARCDGLMVDWRTPADAVTATLGETIRVTLPTGGSLAIGCAGIAPQPYAEALGQAERAVSQWLACCPGVPDQWRAVTRFCWWVLGVSTIGLAGPPGCNRVVVPSKIGYLGLWQWDAYFIAIGLRHGDPDLAVEQLRIALAYPTPAGQLPDVVHDQGTLCSSADLPEADLENLRRLGSPSLANAAVPLTKPPLGPLAVALVAEQAGRCIIDEFLDTMIAAQEWWFRDSTYAGTPAYLHPYSSGLDDSPIFDHDAIVTSPDLIAYLVLADELLATWLTERGRTGEAARCADRAAAMRAWLVTTWDSQREFFPSFGEVSGRIQAETVVTLMPLLLGGLPETITASLAAAVADPRRFATPHRLPTVSAADPGFSNTQMWRGPVWVNTTWLVAHGLHSQGLVTRGDELAEATLRLVASHGPHEYFRPDTGERPQRATILFGWTAALVVDFAVSLLSD